MNESILSRLGSLIPAAAAGDEAAFGRIARWCLPAARGLFGLHRPGDEDARAVAEDVLVRAFQGLGLEGPDLGRRCVRRLFVEVLEVVRARAGTAPAARPADVDGYLLDVRAYLTLAGWCAISGATGGSQDGARTETLRRELDADPAIAFTLPALGIWRGGEEPSLFTSHLVREAALTYGRRFSQEAVITDQGLLISESGRRTPLDPTRPLELRLVDWPADGPLLRPGEEGATIIPLWTEPSSAVLIVARLEEQQAG